MSRMSRHMGLSIQGALTHWTRKQFATAFTDEETGLPVPADEAKQELLTALSEGKRVLPMGDCPDWDYQTGCPGHPLPD